MDLSFARFEHDATVTSLPGDLAVLLVGIVARQAASPTALAQGRLERPGPVVSRFAPPHGAFDPATAALLREPPWPTPPAEP